MPLARRKGNPRRGHAVYDTRQISELVRYLILQQDLKQQARETAKRIVHRVRSVLRKNRKTMLRPLMTVLND